MTLTLKMSDIAAINSILSAVNSTLITGTFGVRPINVLQITLKNGKMKIIDYTDYDMSSGCINFFDNKEKVLVITV